MTRHGIRVPTVGRPQDTAAYAVEVEAAGFDFMWIPDTPWLAGRWRDVYVHLTAAALSTKRIRIGPGVTNPLTRHPLATGSAIQSVHEASDGRADLVVGTGYSSAYIIGRKAATLASMREATLLWRSAFSGAHTVLPGSEIELTPPCPTLPIYLAASGPKALQLAGEIADGVLIMVGAAPGAVAWALEQVDIGMARAGRTRADVQRMLVVTARVDDDRQRAIDEMRPAAAGIYKHREAKTLLSRAGLEVPESIPPLPFIYPDLGHAVDWDAAKAATSYVPDEAVEALVALGSADDVAARARELIALDIDAIWWRDEGTYTRPDDLMRGLVEGVLPKLR
ncbi:MAG: 5,10-methylenetetrahydromethanopterin reductase [Gammaproteobacteria bacterium]|jgi:5,10-methylenetetrahydromethanopterin reductase